MNNHDRVIARPFRPFVLGLGMRQIINGQVNIAESTTWLSTEYFNRHITGLDINFRSRATKEKIWRDGCNLNLSG